MKRIDDKKQSLTELILKGIARVGEGVLEAFLPRQYPEARLTRELLGLHSRRSISRRTFSTILSRLRNQGLVERSGKTRAARWRLTNNGRKYLEKRRISSQYAQEDGVGRLVIFDIPERERKKRDTIRCELVAADFRQLQKSVWIGYRPLPESFLALLDGLYLKEKVHIFSIRDKGTLSDVEN